jgi:diaminopimelate epimerase
MKFEKWQALGNDYLIIERPELPFELTPDRVQKLCAWHHGVGADGVLLLVREADPDIAGSLRIFNADGSEAELSGNGARQAALYMHRHRWSEVSTFTIRTAAGEIRPTLTGPATCRIDIGRASTTSKDFPGGPPDGVAELRAAGRSWRVQHVSIGNPQCSIHVEDCSALAGIDLPLVGPAIERHELFPNRTNVSWYTALEKDAGREKNGGLEKDGGNEKDRIRARIFERGVGETLSSGTGAAGAAVAHVLRRGGGLRTVDVVLDGGELRVEVGTDLRVAQTGWAKAIFEGRLSEELLAELRRVTDVAPRADA